MPRPPFVVAGLIALLALTASRVGLGAGTGAVAYRAARGAPGAVNGFRSHDRGSDSIASRLRTGWRAAGSRQGLLSIGGLPPVPGTISLAGGSLIFQGGEGDAPIAYPLYRMSMKDGKPTRRPAVTLLGIDRARSDAVYLFHLDGGVLETASPGVLQELVLEPSRVDSLGEAWATDRFALVDARDSAAQLSAIRTLAATGYADSMFRLFGTPARPLGLVGERGQRAGRLGEFIASRDSISLSPAKMTQSAQLRHALAHELAHRWQRAMPDELHDLWKGVGPIEDSLRYGFGNEQEHQAEAAAFAVHFLQTTAAPDLPADAALDLLDAYERLVPGTGVMVRRLVAQPIYRYHPLASTLLAPARSVAARGDRHAENVKVF
jgi:hypothetical protein